MDPCCTTRFPPTRCRTAPSSGAGLGGCWKRVYRSALHGGRSFRRSFTARRHGDCGRRRDRLDGTLRRTGSDPHQAHSARHGAQSILATMQSGHRKDQVTHAHGRRLPTARRSNANPGMVLSIPTGMAAMTGAKSPWMWLAMPIGTAHRTTACTARSRQPVAVPQRKMRQVCAGYRRKIALWNTNPSAVAMAPHTAMPALPPQLASTSLRKELARGLAEAFRSPVSRRVAKTTRSAICRRTLATSPTSRGSAYNSPTHAPKSTNRSVVAITRPTPMTVFACKQGSLCNLPAPATSHAPRWIVRRIVDPSTPTVTGARTPARWPTISRAQRTRIAGGEAPYIAPPPLAPAANQVRGSAPRPPGPAPWNTIPSVVAMA